MLISSFPKTFDADMTNVTLLLLSSTEIANATKNLTRPVDSATWFTNDTSNVLLEIARVEIWRTIPAHGQKFFKMCFQP